MGHSQSLEPGCLGAARGRRRPEQQGAGSFGLGESGRVGPDPEATSWPPLLCCGSTNQFEKLDLPRPPRRKTKHNLRLQARADYFAPFFATRAPHRRTHLGTMARGHAAKKWPVEKVLGTSYIKSCRFVSSLFILASFSVPGGEEGRRGRLHLAGSLTRRGA